MKTTEEQLAEALAENERLRAKNEKLAALLPPDLGPGLAYRVGSKCPENLYVARPGEKDFELAKLPTAEYAVHIARVLNAFHWDGEVSPAQVILNTPMQPNGAEAPTIRAYLVELARVGFQEKRPFGNSGWQYELWEALGNAGLMTYTKDEHGYARDVDIDAGYELIAAAMAELVVAR